MRRSRWSLGRGAFLEAATANDRGLMPTPLRAPPPPEGRSATIAWPPVGAARAMPVVQPLPQEPAGLFDPPALTSLVR